MSQGTMSSGAMRSVAAAIRTLGGQPNEPATTRPPGLPFITITRQAGCGGETLGAALIERFNARGADPPWAAFGRALIERVAQDHGLPGHVVESFSERPHSWLEDIAAGLVYKNPRPPDAAVYAKVVATIHALARAGHVVLVGRGSVCCTQDLRTGIHIRLVGDLEDRVARMAARRKLAPDEARRVVEQTDAHREAFYRRFWSQRAQAPERFTLVINTSRVDLEQQVAMIESLTPVRRT